MNANESLVADFLKKTGYHVIRRGWPDFLCVKREWDRISRSYTNVYNGLLAVEVKAGKDTLSEDQQIVHAVLKMAGIPCYVLKPDEVPRKGQLHTRKLWSMREFEGLSGKIYQCMNEVEELQRQLEEKTTRLTELKDILDEATVMVEQTHFRLGRSIEGGNGAEKETGS